MSIDYVMFQSCKEPMCNSSGFVAFTPCIICVQYIGGCSVHRGDTMSTSGDIMSTSRDIMSTSGDVQYIGRYHDECGGYHEYIGGCSVHRREP